jgi:hypothetical protein
LSAGVCAVAVSRDGHWVITNGGDPFRAVPGEPKACEVDTGIVKIFNGHAYQVTCIDISLDSKQLASGFAVWEFPAGMGCAGKFSTLTPVFWTTEDRTIVTAFTFATEHPKTIYEFDSSRLETVGTPFEGRTHCHISGLAVSIDCVLLASASWDNTIKLWAFESRQLLASFDRVATNFLVLSPDSRQIAYTTHYGPPKIYICNIPPETVDSIWPTRQTHGV